MQPWKREIGERFKEGKMAIRLRISGRWRRIGKDVESDVQTESQACKCEERQFLVGESKENPMSCHVNLYKA